MKKIVKGSLLSGVGSRVKNDREFRVRSEKLTLKGVRAILSPEVFENSVFRGVGVFIVNAILMVAVSYLLWINTSWYALIPLWILSGLVISSLFIIGHDANHGALFQSRRLNYIIGQLSMLPSMHAYAQWDFGHNRIHHGHTVKFGGDFVWEPVSVSEYRKYSRLQKILHRLYWSPLGAGIYYLIEIWLKGMMIYTARQKGAVRDKIIVSTFGLLFLGTLFYFGGLAESATFSISGGLWAVARVALIPFLIWNYVIGFTVYLHHINPDISWKKSKNWSPAYGQLFGTVNYHVPRLLNLFFHNIMIHMPHHVHMKIPYYHLPEALAQIKAHYGEFVRERRTMFRDYLEATKKCKLYDPDKEEWLTYAALKN